MQMGEIIEIISQNKIIMLLSVISSIAWLIEVLRLSYEKSKKKNISFYVILTIIHLIFSVIIAYFHFTNESYVEQLHNENQKVEVIFYHLFSFLFSSLIISNILFFTSLVMEKWCILNLIKNPWDETHWCVKFVYFYTSVLLMNFLLIFILLTIQWILNKIMVLN